MIFRKVCENVYAAVGQPAYANVAALVLPGSVVLVDCGIQLPMVEAARNEVEKASGKKVDAVVLTHFHSDHTRALPAFSDCRIICSDLLLKNLKQSGRKVPEGYKPVYPTQTFSKQLELRDGGVTLMVKQTGGHTDCSTYVHCVDYKTVAAGDNLWTEYYPWGGARGGDPDVWIQTLKEYLSLDALHFIPGHGPVGGKESVEMLLEYLEEVRSVMKGMIGAGKSGEEVIKAGGKIKYPPSGASGPHISTLRKWHRIWRERTKH